MLTSVSPFATASSILIPGVLRVGVAFDAVLAAQPVATSDTATLTAPPTALSDAPLTHDGSLAAFLDAVDPGVVESAPSIAAPLAPLAARDPVEPPTGDSAVVVAPTVLPRDNDVAVPAAHLSSDSPAIPVMARPTTVARRPANPAFPTGELQPEPSLQSVPVSMRPGEAFELAAASGKRQPTPAPAPVRTTTIPDQMAAPEAASGVPQPLLSPAPLHTATTPDPAAEPVDLSGVQQLSPSPLHTTSTPDQTLEPVVANGVSITTSSPEPRRTTTGHDKPTSVERRETEPDTATATKRAVDAPTVRTGAPPPTAVPAGATVADDDPDEPVQNGTTVALSSDMAANTALLSALAVASGPVASPVVAPAMPFVSKSRDQAVGSLTVSVRAGVQGPALPAIAAMAIADVEPAKPDPALTLPVADMPRVQRDAAPVSIAPDVQLAVAEHQLDVARDTLWLDRLARDIVSAGSADGKLRFALMPESLGRMDVEVQRGGDGVRVHLTTYTEAARTVIADAQPRLSEELRAQGVRVAETQVSLGTGGRQSDQRGQAQMTQIEAAPESLSSNPKPDRRAARDGRFA